MSGTDDARGISRLPPLRRPVLMDQVWGDAVFVHWAVDPALVQPWMPPGARVDTVGGTPQHPVPARSRRG